MKVIQSFLKNKKGNTLLLATAGAIAATFSIYFFVSITTLSEESKQRVTHLYNAYQMGQSIKGKINGETDERLGNSTLNAIHSALSEPFNNGEFITLSQMVKEAIISIAVDPTRSRDDGEDTPYDLEKSGVLIKYTDVDGNLLVTATDGEVVVGNAHLFVNLAGKTAEDDPSPFYYIVMDDTADANLTAADLTIDTAIYTDGILSTLDGGPQAEKSVALPGDS